MASDAFEGGLRALHAGEAAHWDLFSTTSKDGVHFEYKPEAAAFWEALGDTAVSTFFARMGIKGAGEQANYLYQHGQFNKAAEQQFGKPWAMLSEPQKATTTSVVMANHAKGIDGIREYQAQAKKFGLQDPFANRNTADVLKDLNEQATRHRDALRKADLLIDNAPEKKVSDYDLEPLPVLGEIRVEKESKIWTPEGEKTIKVSEPAAAQTGNRDLATLNVQDREFARQKQREEYAHTVIEQERKRREDQYARKAQQFRDEVKREAQKRLDEQKRAEDAPRRIGRSGAQGHRTPSTAFHERRGSLAATNCRSRAQHVRPDGRHCEPQHVRQSRTDAGITCAGHSVTHRTRRKKKTSCGCRKNARSCGSIKTLESILRSAVPANRLRLDRRNWMSCRRGWRT